MRTRERASAPNSEDKPLSPREVAKYLRLLARMNDDPRLGNPRLGRALLALSDALMHGEPGLVAALEREARTPERVHRPRPNQGEAFSRLSSDEVARIIGDDARPREELADLGLVRFGIARSRLMRMSREAIVDAIRAALEHERSLSIIAAEAQRGGTERRS